MVDRLADAINTIKTNEHMGRSECVVLATKLVRAVVDVMVRSSYIDGYTEFDDRYTKKMRLTLANKINEIGVIKPRISVDKDSIQHYEERFVPSREFGILIVSTSQGIMTNREAKEKKIGGRLIAYVY